MDVYLTTGASTFPCFQINWNQTRSVLYISKTMLISHSFLWGMSLAKESILATAQSKGNCFGDRDFVLTL